MGGSLHLPKGQNNWIRTPLLLWSWGRGGWWYVRGHFPHGGIPKGNPGFSWGFIAEKAPEPQDQLREHAGVGSDLWGGMLPYFPKRTDTVRLVLDIPKSAGLPSPNQTETWPWPWVQLWPQPQTKPLSPFPHCQHYQAVFILDTHPDQTLSTFTQYDQWCCYYQQ